MTNKMVFVFGVWDFLFFIFLDDFALKDMTLILGVDMNASVSIETHITYDKLFILMQEW
jgi:hypothetical protein